MKDIDKDNEKWKGPRRQTLDQASPRRQQQAAKGNFMYGNTPGDADGILAAENYDALKAMMENMQRR